MEISAPKTKRIPTKKLYSYQESDINTLFEKLEQNFWSLKYPAKTCTLHPMQYCGQWHVSIGHKGY